MEFEKQKYDFMDDVITLSIGMAIWQSEWTAEELFDNADTAMYDSKKKGKNKTKL